MSIWFRPFSIETANRNAKECAHGSLGIVFTDAGADHLSGRMPVDERTRQPAGLLHGGASVLFAETLASWAATWVVDPDRFHCVGQEINANHLRRVRDGWVEGTAKPIHIGRRSQVWQVNIHDEAKRLVCISRVTMAVLSGPAPFVT